VDTKIYTIIDKEKCNGCGMCVNVCEYKSISVIDGKACIIGHESSHCGHCQAVCPVGAIKVTCLSPIDYKTVKVDDTWLKPGTFDTPALFKLMASRRSCRNYKKSPVSVEQIEDLISAAQTAPSGSNAQSNRYTVLTGNNVDKLCGLVSGFYRLLNFLARIAPLRFVVKDLADYHRDYYEFIRTRLDERKKTGKDIFFHGAQELIIITTSTDATTPVEDAAIAAQNIMLAAHAMGLGTCFIGFAVEAIRHDGKIKKALHIGKEETAQAVIALGWPDEKYSKMICRIKKETRYLSL
jgi:nitroreductase/NAD-dependent dihydropyrimidine dehydrogenase PreA subunit